MLSLRAAFEAALPRADAGLWVPLLERSGESFEIDRPARAGMWLANIAFESVELTELEENLAYKTVARLRAVFPRFFPDDAIASKYIKAGPEAIASRVYANRLGNGDEESGDGWAYRARGPLGITFRSNYMAAGLKLFGDVSLLAENPEYVTDPEIGAATAAWFWDQADANTYADENDFDGVCDVINIGHKTRSLGDSNGFASREHYLKVLRDHLA